MITGSFTLAKYKFATACSEGTKFANTARYSSMYYGCICHVGGFADSAKRGPRYAW